MIKESAQKSPHRLIAAVTAMSLTGVLLLVLRIIDSNSTRYVFLVWNLLLAAVTPLLAWWLVRRVRRYGWAHWKQFYLTIIWIVFLPNSFYILTDFIHLRQTYEASLLYDIVMLTSFALSGLIMGFISVYLIHVELGKRLRPPQTWVVIGTIFLASSFAICLGRFTRWNTWDIFLKPAGLLFDVSDRVVNPSAHGETYVVTAVFFVLLFSVYWVIWETTQLLRSK